MKSDAFRFHKAIMHLPSHITVHDNVKVQPFQPGLDEDLFKIEKPLSRSALRRIRIAIEKFSTGKPFVVDMKTVQPTKRLSKPV